MSVRRIPVSALLLVGLVAAIVAVALVIGNPSVRASTTGERFPCLASYDMVLNHAANDPDGEPGLPGEDISAKCDAAGHRQFWAGVATGGVAAVLLGTGLTVLIVRRAGRRTAPVLAEARR